MPVLGAKVHLPAPRRQLVRRGRLRDLLPDRAQGSPRLVLVSAPAGFGKTTLLSSWLAGPYDSQGQRSATPAFETMAWLSLEPTDSDLGRFLDGLVAALRAACPGLGDEATALLEGNNDPPAQEVVTSLLQDLDALAGSTVIVLDDYHVITSSAVHEAVSLLLDHLPPQTTLAMTTRADPPLPLARLRARGELVEVRAHDLRFTTEESTTFLNDVMGLSLTPAQVAALESRTEGWAAGLQLAGLSMRGRESIDEFVAAFSGTHRFVLDYLVEEVLAAEPAETRDFLLDTSVLDRLSGPLCAAVTGRPDAPQLLETLDRDNLFVIALDDDRRWFRYHHLFADTLRSRLQATDPDRAARLQLAASRWFAEQGELAPAVTHALASGDPDAAAELMELAFHEMRRTRQDRTLRGWLRLLPEDVVRRRPLLATLAAWERLSEGDLAAVGPWLDAAESALAGVRTAPPTTPGALARAAGLREAELRALPAWLEIYRASVAQARGDVDGTVDHARRALSLAEPDDHSAIAGGAGFLGLAAWGAGDLPTAIATFSDTARSLAAAGSTADELGTTVLLASMWLARGRPDEAGRLLRQALTTAGHHAGPPLSSVGDLHVALADILRESGELDEAETHLNEAQTLGERASLLEYRYRWHTTMAALRRARGELAGAVAELDEAERLFLPGYFPDVRPIAAVRAATWIAQGRLDEARGWLGDRDLDVEGAPAYLEEYVLLTAARLRLAEARVATTVDLTPTAVLLDRIAETATAAGRGGSALEARMLGALVAEACGDLEAALVTLTSVLAEARPVGYARLFLDEGDPIERLLGELVARPDLDAADHARQLLAISARPSGAAEPPELGREDMLSERELEVLRLLATELTGPEISRRLFISVNTLRTHTKHIFTKLDVTTRRSAVRRGSDLGLL